MGGESIKKILILFTSLFLVIIFSLPTFAFGVFDYSDTFMLKYTYNGAIDGSGVANISTVDSPGYHLKWANGVEVIYYYHLNNGCNIMGSALVHIPLVNWYFFVVLTDDVPTPDYTRGSSTYTLYQCERRDVDGNIDRVGSIINTSVSHYSLNTYVMLDTSNYYVHLIRVKGYDNVPITNSIVEGKPSAGDTTDDTVLPDDVIDDIEDRVGQGAVDQLYLGDEETTEEYTGTTEYKTYSQIENWSSINQRYSEFSEDFNDKFSNLSELSEKIVSNYSEVSSDLSQVRSVYDGVMGLLPTWLIAFLIMGAIMIIAVKVTN